MTAERQESYGWRPGIAFIALLAAIGAPAGQEGAPFVAHPEIYGPQFGGYDPIDLARGVTCGGNPQLWAVTGQRLYLFGREEHRDAFAADPGRFVSDASAQWPALQQDLAR